MSHGCPVVASDIPAVREVSGKSAFLVPLEGIIPSVWAEPGGPTHTLIEWLCSGRPVLVSRRGGLGEVIDLYAGAISVEPTVEGVIRGINELADSSNWPAVLRPIDSAGKLDGWVSAHA